jgi:hypothetical protein
MKEMKDLNVNNVVDDSWMKLIKNILKYVRKFLLKSAKNSMPLNREQ